MLEFLESANWEYIVAAGVIIGIFAGLITISGAFSKKKTNAAKADGQGEYIVGGASIHLETNNHSVEIPLSFDHVETSSLMASGLYDNSTTGTVDSWSGTEAKFLDGKLIVTSNFNNSRIYNGNFDFELNYTLLGPESGSVLDSGNLLSSPHDAWLQREKKQEVSVSIGDAMFVFVIMLVNDKRGPNKASSSYKTERLFEFEFSVTLKSIVLSEG